MESHRKTTMNRVARRPGGGRLAALPRTVERLSEPLISSRRGDCSTKARLALARTRRGFTLIESALATVIVGVGVLAIVAAQRGLHTKNEWSTHASIATRLGNEIREMTLNLPRHDPVTGQAIWGPEGNETWFGDYDDLDDFDGSDGEGSVFSAVPDGEGNVNGPINARREIIPDMEGWTQIVTVSNVDPFDINVELVDGGSNMIMVHVTVTFQGPADDDPRTMTTVSWIAPQ